MISGIMPRWQRKLHLLGFAVMSLAFTGIAVLSLRFLFQALAAPAEGNPAPVGSFLSSLVMIAVSVLGIVAQLWFRRRVVCDFSYEGRTLRFSTLGRPEAQTRQASEIADIAEWRGRRGPQGYRLRFRDGGKIYLQYGIANSSAAAEQLGRDSQRTAG